MKQEVKRHFKKVDPILFRAIDQVKEVEEIIIAIEENKILDIVEHRNKKQYPNQKIFVINMTGYAYLVPFVEDKQKIFLKTIIPSRKATKKYIIKK